jgi:hypothetical protein
MRDGLAGTGPIAIWKSPQRFLSSHAAHARKGSDLVVVNESGAMDSRTDRMPEAGEAQMDVLAIRYNRLTADSRRISRCDRSRGDRRR